MPAPTTVSPLPLEEGATRPAREPATWAWPLAASAVAVVVLALVVAGSLTSFSLDLPWVEALDIRFSIAFDDLALAYGGLAAAVGASVLAWSAAYLPYHLHEKPREQIAQGTRPDDGGRFGRATFPRRLCTLLLAFLASMVVLACAKDLALLFFAFELTALCSFALIRIDDDEPSRRAATLALVLTGLASLCFLLGAALILAELGTGDIDAILAHAARDDADQGLLHVGMSLIAVAALAKSAQMPLHFWLPRAMVAPTPVSAYLHSAAMVAAGVFVLARLSGLYANFLALREVLFAVGATSMLVGGVFALTAERLKEILAWSTIAHLGVVVAMLASGTEEEAEAATVYVLAHGIAKSALFMVAGTVKALTGEDRLTKTGGVLRRSPALGMLAAVAAASLAGAPLTFGYLAEEGALSALEHQGALQHGVGVAAVALTVGYMLRFWAGIFLPKRNGSDAAEHDRPPRWPVFVGPGVLHAVLLITVGVAGPRCWPRLAPDHEGLASSTWVAWLSGPLLFLLASRARLGRITSALAPLGPHRWARLLGRVLDAAAAFLAREERHELRSRIAGVILPSLPLVGMALWLAPGSVPLTALGDEAHFRLDAVTRMDVAVSLLLIAAAIIAVAIAFQRHHLGLVLTLATVSTALAACFALAQAPDVALIAALLGMAMCVLFVGTLSTFPRSALEREEQLSARQRWRRQDPFAAAAAAAVATWVAAVILGHDAPPQVASVYLEAAPGAGAQDVVTAILADFRGLDTLGEATVMVTAALVARSLLRARGGQW